MTPCVRHSEGPDHLPKNRPGFGARTWLKWPELGGNNLDCWEFVAKRGKEVCALCVGDVREPLCFETKTTPVDHGKFPRGELGKLDSVIHDGHIVCSRRTGDGFFCEHNSTPAGSQEGANGVDPWTWKAMDRKRWIAQKMTRQSGDMLPPLKGHFQEGLSWSLQSEVSLKGQKMLCALFNKTVGEANASKLSRSTHKCFGRGSGVSKTIQECFAHGAFDSSPCLFGEIGDWGAMSN